MTEATMAAMPAHPTAPTSKSTTKSAPKSTTPRAHCPPPLLAILSLAASALGLAPSLGCRREDAVAAAKVSDDHTRRGARPGAAKKRSRLPAHTEHSTLAEAVLAVIPPRTRMIGLGELHSRVDRPHAPSTLVRFTEEILPALPERTSDLILETWAVDGRCGKEAAKTTAQLEAATKRPETTKSELGILFDRSRGRGLRTHGMRVTCDDYRSMAGGGDDAIIHMLDLTTAELTRLSVAYLRRAAASTSTPKSVIAEPSLVVVYGGALHNDRFPAAGLASWSYAPAVEADSERTYVEIDLITPELADDDVQLATQPWAPLLGASAHVLTYQRGERSFVIILPRANADAAAGNKT